MRTLECDNFATPINTVGMGDVSLETDIPVNNVSSLKKKKGHLKKLSDYIKDKLKK